MISSPRSAVFVRDQYAYMAAQWAGLIVIDVSDPAQPKVVGGCRRQRDRGLRRRRRLEIWRADLKWLRVLDVSEPSAPRELAAFRTPSYAEDVWIADDFAYLANFDAGVMVLAFKQQ